MAFGLVVRYSIASATEVILSASASGISTANSSSIAITTCISARRGGVSFRPKLRARNNVFAVAGGEGVFGFLLLGFLKSHLHGVQAVEAEVGGEAGGGRDLFGDGRDTREVSETATPSSHTHTPLSTLF